MAKLPQTKISQLIERQLPLFVRENYDNFIAFLKAYYEWLELPGNAVAGITTVLDDRDIDKTLDAFISYFKYEFMIDIPNNILTDKRKLVKHIKQFYTERGTQNSYKFLFRIMFNEDVEFFLPKVDLLRASDGKWVVDTVVRSTTNHNTFAFIGHLITGSISGATAAVENIVQFQIGANTVSEIYISDIKGTFQQNENIICNVPGIGLVEESLYNMVVGVNITNPGLKYAEDSLVLIVDGGGQNAIASVKIVFGNDSGRVVAATNTFIENPGPSQTILPPSITLNELASSIDGFYNGITVTITDGPGANEFKEVISYNGTTKVAIVDSDWDVIPTVQSHYNLPLGKIKSVQIKDFGISYINPSVDFTQSGDGTATGTAIIDVVGRYPGRFITTDGFLSDIKKIQDSFFWQDFSYVLKAQESLNLYKDAVKLLLHPAGTILFGEVDISTHLQIGPDFRTLERHKFFFPPYEGFSQIYPSPNSTYWGDPFGFPNTQNEIEGNVINGDVDSKPTTKRNHIADCNINITQIPDAIPPASLLVQYDCVQGIDPQVLYDVKIGTPKLNGILGRKTSADSADPTFVSTGLQFEGIGQFANCSAVPVNPIEESVMIVVNPDSLSAFQSIIGSIDSEKENTTTGYSINFDVDGSIKFIAQKYNGTMNQLVTSFGPGSILPSTWTALTLRYKSNTLVGNINDLFQVQNSFLTNVDGTFIQNNSAGWYIGNEGFVPPFFPSSFWKSSLWKRTLWKFRPTRQENVIVDDSYWGKSKPDVQFWGGGPGVEFVTIPISKLGNSFNGVVAYAIIWNRYITDLEQLQAYIYLRTHLASRGITLP